ncbi:MAG: Rieske 2Fe-2S domain-containing protein [Burkholderiaceae bacterium]
MTTHLPGQATAREADWPASLVESARVHRDVYTSESVFALEQQRLFRRSWLYLGHDSQLPAPGDFLALTLAGQPMLVLRQPDGEIIALENRCLHKGTPLVTVASGNAGRMLRCAYHGWSYRHDGRLLAIPLREGYAGTPFAADAQCPPRLMRFESLRNYRGFLFIRLAPQGLSLEQWFGPALAALDNMADRSPAGRLEVVGRPLQHRIACNWKIYLENINDAMHPVSAHRSAAATAQRLWRAQPPDTAKPMAIEQMLPFGSDYEFFNGMGARILPNGHSFFGTRFNIHSAYAALDDYTRAMHASHGEAATRAILGFQSQNTVLYPSVSVKGSPLAIRVLRPVSAAETVLESWAFHAIDAPDHLLERALTYNRVAFSPMSVVAHDDVHLFEAIQRNLLADSNPWVALQREGANPEALAGESRYEQEVSSGSEALMRNQFKAWAHRMGEQDPPA